MSKRYIWIFISFGLSVTLKPGTPAICKVDCWSITFWSRWLIIFLSVSRNLWSCLIFITFRMCSNSSESWILADQPSISSVGRKEISYSVHLYVLLWLNVRFCSISTCLRRPERCFSVTCWNTELWMSNRRCNNSLDLPGSPLNPWQFQRRCRLEGNWPVLLIARMGSAFGTSWKRQIQEIQLINSITDEFRPLKRIHNDGLP